MSDGIEGLPEEAWTERSPRGFSPAADVVSAVPLGQGLGGALSAADVQPGHQPLVGAQSEPGGDMVVVGMVAGAPDPGIAQGLSGQQQGVGGTAGGQQLLKIGRAHV